MKRVHKMPALCLIMLTFLLAVSFLGVIFSGKQASAEVDPEDNGTYISAYDISYVVKSDRSMTVKEVITVNFDNKSYMTRLIPCNAGEMIRNVKVSDMPQGDSYDTYITGDYVAVDMGGTRKTGEYSYTINYDYNLTRAQEGADVLALTPISRELGCLAENITFSFLLPAGYVDGSADCFLWFSDNTQKNIATSAVSAEDGRVKIAASIESLPAGTEVRIDFGFEKGALSTYTDLSSYLFVIVAVVVLVLLILVKFIFFNKSTLMPVINLSAPDKMNPLMMGKLIDNKVNPEDITSMIFYWADKGYLKIALDDADDPTLIRIIRNLPDTCQDYERTMFNALFRIGDAVKVSQLKNSFYVTVNAVTQTVNAQAKNLYSSKSIGVSIIFALLGGLIMGAAPFLLATFTIASSIKYYFGFVSILTSLGIYALAETVSYNRLKSKNKKIILLSCGIALIAAVCCALYVWIIPSFIISVIPKILLTVVGYAIVGLSVILISRTPAYTEKLNDIVGFRNYILYAEKDRLEAMLEEDPQFYYHVLPYAQVLNVTDVWEEKFKNLTVAPPVWATYSSGNVTDFIIISAVLRNMRTKTTSALVSRPSSSSVGGSGKSGGGHGSFGGHSGGGHGGGGVRFR